jgi:hypothetical protein
LDNSARWYLKVQLFCVDKEVKNKIKNGIQQKLKQTALPTKPFLLTLAETLATIKK